jgi:hypothetical protein
MGDVFVDPDFMAAQTARSHRRVNRLGLGFVFVALQALFGVDTLVQRDGMNRGRGANREQREQNETNSHQNARPAAPGYAARL